MIAFLVIPIVLASALSFSFFYLRSSTSPLSVALVYEGNGAPYDKDFFPNETAYFSFNVSHPFGRAPSFYLNSYGGNYSEEVYSVRLSGSRFQLVNFSVSAGSLSPFLYYV